MADLGSADRDIEQALVALKKGAQLLKYGRKGKPKFYPFRLSSDYVHGYAIYTKTVRINFLRKRIALQYSDRRRLRERKNTYLFVVEDYFFALCFGQTFSFLFKYPLLMQIKVDNSFAKQDAPILECKSDNQRKF